MIVCVYRLQVQWGDMVLFSWFLAIQTCFQTSMCILYIYIYIDTYTQYVHSICFQPHGYNTTAEILHQQLMQQGALQGMVLVISQYVNMRNLRQIIYDRFSQLSKMTRDFVSLNFCTQLHHILYSNQMFPKCCFILAGIDTAPHGYLLGEGMKPMLKAS